MGDWTILPFMYLGIFVGAALLASFVRLGLASVNAHPFGNAFLITAFIWEAFGYFFIRNLFLHLNLLLVAVCYFLLGVVFSYAFHYYRSMKGFKINDPNFSDEAPQNPVWWKERAIPLILWNLVYIPFFIIAVEVGYMLASGFTRKEWELD